MNNGIRRSLWITLSILVSIAGSAHAQTWTSIPMTVVEKQGTESLNALPPYALGIPTAAAPTYRRYLSSLESSVPGFRFRGFTTDIGSGTDDHNGLSAGYTSSATFTGTEFGLVVYLPDGLMRLYQCLNCNTATMQWNDVVVYNTPQNYYDYEVVVNSDGSFTFKVVSTVSPFTVIQTTTIAKESWMPNLYPPNPSAGYLHITAAHDSSNGSWSASTLHVDEIDILQ
jgi:hypothetical protein